MREGQWFHVGHIDIHPQFTPGHTDHHHASLIDNDTRRLLFCGDLHQTLSPYTWIGPRNLSTLLA